MRVLKFGGTSVGDGVRVRRVLEVVGSRPEGESVLVFSAVGHTTDHLEALGEAAARGDLASALSALERIRGEHLALAHQLLVPGEGRRAVERHFDEAFTRLEGLARGLAAVQDLSAPVRDRLLGEGELLSTRLLAAALAQAGRPARWVDARELVATDGHHGEAEPDFAATAERCARVLRPLLEAGLLPVTQGFLGRGPSGLPTTLGRGGSDYTASLLGAALGAEEIEIWTDVDGILTADPTLVPEARNIPVLSFREAAELAFFGARVLHPKTLLPALERGIPVRVKNTARPEGAGTLVLSEAPAGGPPVKCIAYKEGVALVHLVSARMFRAHGYLRRLFEVCDRHRLAPDAVATSEVAVAMVLPDVPALDAAVDAWQELGTVRVARGRAVVCVAGEGLQAAPGIVGQIFEDLAGVSTELVSHGGSEVALCFAVAEVDLAQTVRRLHDRFFPAQAEEVGRGAA